MIPIVAGLLMGAAMGGGIAALQKKDILQGALMGGIGGALGGAFMPGVAGAVGGEAVGTAAGSGLAPVASEGISSALANSGSLFSGGSLTGGAANLGLKTAGSQALMPSAMGVPASTVAGSGLTIPTSMAGAGTGAGSGSMFSGGIGNFLSQNKGALTGGALGGMMAPGQEPEQRSEGNIREFSFNPGERNPLFGNPGESYYTADRGFTEGAVIPVEDYDKANGGIIALAEGGAPGIEMQRYARPVRTVDPAVAAYNAQIMERANQQYNVNLRPGPNQVPGSIGYVAPVPRAKKEPVEYTDLINSPKKNIGELDDDMYAELDARYGKNYYPSGNDGDGGAYANGGLMRGYNEGGLSSLGSYSDGGQLLRGPGDGVSDSIPARIGSRQPARLANNEFVVPARVVSEIGNGSTDAGAKRLYDMMDRVQKRRNKTIGKGKIAVDSKAHKELKRL
jgi:hypothetical protein